MELVAKALQHIWYPCSQMKDYESFKPLHVVRANGSHIELQDGKKIIDAISSWWCKSLGHNHPRLKAAAMLQLEKFEHVILANTTNDIIVKLSAQLALLSPTLNKIFFAGDGSSAIEIALKMSLHSRKITGETARKNFICLQNSYHGDSIGALSVSDLAQYRGAYADLLFTSQCINHLPYVNGPQHPLWLNCESHWQNIEAFLMPLRDTTTAIIVEPIVQGAGGMKIYSPDLLRRLRTWTQQHNIHLIADEIMTGIYRTGKMLACEYANIEPDFLCLAKGLTSGWLPFSVVLTRSTIYNLFYADFHTGNSFLHSHTYSGNALAASIALCVLQIMQEEKMEQKVKLLEHTMQQYWLQLAAETNKLIEVRALGGIVAAELVCTDATRRVGYEIYQKAVQLGALLRPLGNTLYWLPPLNIDETSLHQLYTITRKAILAVEF